MKILIIRLSSLGDIVLTEPIIRRLRKVFPEAELHYLVKEQFSSIPKAFGTDLQILSYRKSPGFHFGLMSRRYDYVFDLHNKFSTWLLKLFCYSAKIFTYDKMHRLRRRITQHKTSAAIPSTLESYRSALTQAARLTGRSELAQELDFPILKADDKVMDSIRKRLADASNQKTIALFPGATHYTKRYPAELFAEFIRLSGDRYRFLLLGSKQEQTVCERIQALASVNVLNLCGAFNLTELLAVISCADGVVTNDSGPMHLAAALGIPLVAIFGATHPRLGFKPLSERAVVLSSELSCQPCSLHGSEKCPLGHLQCLHNINPKSILEALTNLL